MSKKLPFCRAYDNEDMLVFQVGPEAVDTVCVRVDPTAPRPPLEEVAEEINKAVANRELEANCAGIREGMIQ